MNSSVFWRLVWKEYRLQRAFWISMAVLTVLVQLLVLALVRPGADRITWLFTLGLGLPAFYALGCGSTLFAAEHEARTYGFQRALPVSAMGLFGSKMAFAVGSILAMVGLLWVVSAAMAGWRLPAAAQHTQLWGLWGVAALELLLWGIFFSLLIPRPLLAAILAATAASVTVHCALPTLNPTFDIAPYLAAVPYRLAIAAAVALLDELLAYGWFREMDGRSGGAAHLRRLGRLARGQWAVIILLLLPLLAVVANGRWFARTQNPWALAAWGFKSLEIFVWAAFFCLLLRRSLNLTILAVAALSCGVHVAAAGTTLIDALCYLVIPFRGPMVGAVALADLLLVYQRHREGTDWTVAASHVALVPGPTRGTVLGRLLWQQWRQSIWVMAAASVLVVPLLVEVAMQRSQSARADGFRFTVVAILAAVTAPLMGACVFLADQRGRSFRFFAEHGVRPRYVWLSRHLVWMAALLLWSALVFVALLCAFGHPQREPEYEEAVVVLGYLVGWALVVYGGGQLCSMFVRSGILAGFSAVLLGGLLSGWAWLMWFLQVPWIWSVAPIPAVLLLVTWLRAPDWVLERNSVRAWLGPALTLMVLTAALLTAVPVYRVYEIPEVDPGFSPAAFARPATAEELETFEMYRRAAWLYVPIKERELPEGADEATAPPELEAERAAREAAWIEANEEAIALTVKASRRAACDFCDVLSGRSRADVMWDVRSLCQVLFASAAQLQSEGKLDAAWERYLAALRVSLHLRDRGAWIGPHVADWVEQNVYDRLPAWAAQPGQTPPRIEAAIRQLAELARDVPSRSDAIKSEYLWTRRIISADADTLARELDVRRGRVFWAALALQWLPWERARAVRVLSLITARSLRSIREVESAISDGASLVLPDDGGESLDVPRSTPLWAVFRGWNVWAETRDLAAMETRRRAVRVQMALLAWKTEHGELPKTLRELVGTYLDRLPLDPHSAEPFRYFPGGLPIPITSSRWGASEPEVVEAGTPFVWSVGEQVVVRDAGEAIPDRYRVDAGFGEGRRPTSQYDVWESGWAFPLP